MISGGVLLQAPPTYHIQMHALDGYVFILHDSVGFSQICGGSGGIYLRKRTDITIYPVVVMPCTHCLKYIYIYIYTYNFARVLLAAILSWLAAL